MGSSQSARKLTISNEEEVGVIKVSSDIVHRLSQGIEDNVNKHTGASGTSTSSAATASSDVRKPMTTVQHPNVVHKAPILDPNTDLSSGYPLFYYPELTISAFEMQQQKERELAAQEDYWQKRMRDLEENQKVIKKLVQTEYERAIAEVSSSSDSKDVNAQNSVAPCIENSKKVLKCYQDHPKETLRCSNLVEEFSNCVDQRRQRVIAARC